MEAKLTYDEFKSQLNQNFLMKVEGADSLNLELIEISEHKVTEKQDLFAVTFKGPASPLMPQQIYELEHSSMGQMKLFLVPIRKDDEAVYYEAVFNRMVKQA